jgi:RNA polymerase sigma-70 factor (ECF subfamily)
MQTMSPVHAEQAVTRPVRPARTRWSSGERKRALSPEQEAAYSAFFRAHFANVTRTIHLIVHDQLRAEDLTQDAFLALLRDWPRLSAYDRPEAWVRRVAIRLAMRGRRRDALWLAVRGLFVPRADGPGPDPDLQAAVARLPTAQRVAIVLHYYEDRPVAEIASLLGCAEATARVHLHRGRQRLAVLLGDEGDDASRP